MKKRLLALGLAAGMALSLAGCGGTQTDSDKAYVQNKGTLVVGIADFEPMDYQDEAGN